MPASSDNPPTTLRERQGQRVREELRAAFVRLVVEQGVHGFSLHEVAKAASVSDRTLYRYYPNREALIDDVLSTATEVIDAAQLERGARSRGTEQLDQPDSVAGAFEVFEQHADLVRVIAQIRESGLVDRHHEARSVAEREALASSGVDPEALDALATLVRMLTGSDGWLRMTSPEFGLGSREAGLAAHWAAQVLVDAASRHKGPLRPTFGRQAGDESEESGAQGDGKDS